MNAKKIWTIERSIIAYFVLFSGFFALAVPPFEAPDELSHLSFINYITAKQALPNQYTSDKDYVPEGHQPPLYYFLGAVLSRSVLADRTIAVKPIRNERNQDWGGRDKYAPTFKHAFNNVFTAANDRLSFYLLRLMSVVLGAITLMFIFRLSALFELEKPWIYLPALLVASLPQYAFLSGMINNDNLTTTLGTAILFCFFSLIDRPEQLKNYILTGLCLGLGLLTKTTTISLLAGTVIILASMAGKMKMKRMTILRNSAILLLVAAAIGAFFYVRNLALYGELTGMKMVIQTDGSAMAQARSVFSLYFVSPFIPGLFVSFIGALGLIDLYLPLPVYLFYLVILGLSLIGLWFFRPVLAKQKERFLAAIIFSGLSLISLVYLNTMLPLYQGRYLYTVISLIAILAVLGWRSLAQRLPLFIDPKLVVIALSVTLVFIDLLTMFLTWQFYYRPEQYL
jgi:4-amino-4-deoxy-L-arabinose transferase-like glycosyltransferase